MFPFRILSLLGHHLTILGFEPIGAALKGFFSLVPIVQPFVGSVVGSPFRHVAAHIVKAKAVGSKASHRAGEWKAIIDG